MWEAPLYTGMMTEIVFMSVSFGFSTIAEVIAGMHAGMRILGLSTITNLNDPDHPAPISVEEVIVVAGITARKLEKLVRRIVAGL